MAAATLTTTADPHGMGVIDARLLASPLEFIAADHLRQRHLCCLLERLAQAPSLDPGLASTVVYHLTGDMVVHVLDEEEDLFPLLRRRAAPDDGIARVLGLLASEHREDERLGAIIVAGVREACAADAPLSDEARAACRSFARRQRRHLAVENALVLPLAGARLTPLDMKGLGRRMAVRRGLDPSTGRPA